MHRLLARDRQSPRTARLLRTIDAVAIMLMLVGLSLVVNEQPTRAASTYCGVHGSVSSIGGTGIYSDLMAYGDSGCTGTRSRQFYHRAATSPSTTLAYIGYEPSVGLRAWDCGTQYYGWTYGLGGVSSNNLYGQWSSSNSCGFQGDQNTKFVKSGYSDVWIYAYS